MRPFPSWQVLFLVLVFGCGQSSPSARFGASVDEGGTPSASAADRDSATGGGGEEALNRLGGDTDAGRLATPTSASGIGWPRFRGPTGTGTSAAADLPLAWSATENIAWRAELPGPGASSPIVFGDHIYVTCYTGYFVPDKPGGSLDQLERHLIAVGRTDGEILWDRAIAAKLPEENQIRDHGFAANTPAADAERVYVFFGKSGVFAFDHDGIKLWHADVGSKTSGWGTAASPVLHDDLVIINASVESESLVALDRRTGEERWRAGV